MPEIAHHPGNRAYLGVDVSSGPFKEFLRMLVDMTGEIRIA
jgi:hypothetical protein